MNFSAISFSIMILLGIKGTSQNHPLIAEGAALRMVADGFEFTEGPATDSEGNVFFTDQPNNKIYKWSAEENTVSIFLDKAGRSNGLYFDPAGNLYAAADQNSEIWKIDPHKNISVVLRGFRDEPFNGPNDIWIAPNGGIYFTDPYYERPYRNYSKQPIAAQRVYFLSPDRKQLKIATEELIKPNGIIGTPDGKTIFIADIADNKTWKYSVAEDGTLRNKVLFTHLGSDGMTLDNSGNVYLTGEGVTVFNPKGEKILHIPVNRKWTANVTFGGKENSTLFITAMDSVFSIEMNVKGATTNY